MARKLLLLVALLAPLALAANGHKTTERPATITETFTAHPPPPPIATPSETFAAHPPPPHHPHHHSERSEPDASQKKHSSSSSEPGLAPPVSTFPTAPPAATLQTTEPGVAPPASTFPTGPSESSKPGIAPPATTFSDRPPESRSSSKAGVATPVTTFSDRPPPATVTTVTTTDKNGRKHTETVTLPALPTDASKDHSTLKTVTLLSTAKGPAHDQDPVL